MRKWGNVVCSGRPCDDEARGRSNPGKQVQHWVASCLAMTLLGNEKVKVPFRGFRGEKQIT